MRKKLWRERHPRGPFDIKYRAGGLLDIEFILQVMVLQAPPGLIAPGSMTVGGLIRYFAEQNVLDEHESKQLLQAHLLLTDLSQTASVASEKTHQFLSRSSRDGLLKAFLDRHDWDHEHLEANLNNVCSFVRKIFVVKLGVYW
jgi:Glutamine synthetase adenylyltransferase